MFKTNEDIINDIVNGVELSESAFDVINRDADINQVLPATCGNCINYSQRTGVCRCPSLQHYDDLKYYSPVLVDTNWQACFFWQPAAD